MWDKTINSIRSCEIVNHEGKTDLIAFPGWEWTQIGNTPENHWGHRNVIFKDLDSLPARPIGSRTPESGLGVFNMTRQAINARWIDPLNFKFSA